MAPPLGLDWRLRFSSDYHRYGGSGAAEIKLEDLIIPGHTASLLAPVVRDQGREETSR
jgi:hypothetical protein